MPHYADGTPAQVGDRVIGKPYNTPHEVFGEVLQITPNSETCNLIVAFTELKPLSQEEMTTIQRHLAGQAVCIGTNEQKYFLITSRYDYGETKAFHKVADKVA